MIANIITLSRLPFAFAALYCLCSQSPRGIVLGMVLGFMTLSADMLDGYVARKLNQCSALGSLFDVTVDRISEISAWITFAYLQMLPVWFPIFFLTRGLFTDIIRNDLLQHGVSCYEQDQSIWFRMIVSNIWMRRIYALMKGHAMFGLAILLYLKTMSSPLAAHGIIFAVTYFLVYASLAFCIARALPVWYAYYVHQKEGVETR